MDTREAGETLAERGMEVDHSLRDQVCLELIQINIEGTVETKGGGDRRDDLGNEAVEVGESRGRDV